MAEEEKAIILGRTFDVSLEHIRPTPVRKESVNFLIKFISSAHLNIMWKACHQERLVNSNFTENDYYFNI